MQAIYYTNDNITFKNNDSWIELSELKIDSTELLTINKKQAILYGEISERPFSTDSSIIPCKVYIPQCDTTLKVIGNNFEIELTGGYYNILVYNRSGEAIYHNLFVSERKKYFLHYTMGREAIVCRSKELRTDTFSIKYFGDPFFFFNATDTIGLGGSILHESLFDVNIVQGYGKISFNVFRRLDASGSIEKNRVKAKLIIPELSTTKELTEDDNEVLLPQGYHTIFVVSDGFSPQRVFAYIQEGQWKKLDVFLGYNTLRRY